MHVTDSVTSGHSYSGAFHFADGANTDTEYEYDDNGNMTKDLNRGITGITYNALNLPSVVSFTDNSYIEYTYGADGQKLRTQYGVQPGLGPLTPADTGEPILGEETAGTDAVGTIPSTDELNRMDYCGNVVYDRGERRLLLENGYVTFDITTNTPSYHFYLRDHLGNNRVVMAGDGTVEQVTHYYPFGGVMRESTNPGLQPYKYGGKELDRTSGLDAYDFGARMFFADRMQWGQMDPLCEKYYDVSPYEYCHNTPVNLYDLDGRDDWYDKHGTFQNHFDNETDNIIIKRWEITLTFGDFDFTVCGGDYIENCLLTAEAYSNIFTDILSNMNDVDISCLHNDRVSVTIIEDDINWLKIADRYNDAFKSGDCFAEIGRFGDKQNLTAYIFKDDAYKLDFFSTVSNIQNLLGAHEYIGHFKNGYSDNEHDKIVNIQMNHPSWEKTTENFKKHYTTYYAK